MPWNYPGGYPSPDDFFSLLQQAKFQLPHAYSPLPPPYSPAPQGSLFNPMQAQGLGVGRPPGGYTGGYGLRPEATPPGLGGAVPGASVGQPTPLPSASGTFTPGGGDFRGNAGASGSWGGATGSWTPATAVPPEMAQAGLPSTSGLLGMLWGNPKQLPGLTYGDWTTPNHPQLPGLQYGDWTTPGRAQPDTKPLPADKTITDLRPPSGPTGASGKDAVTGAKLKTVRPQEGTTPQAKASDQARYTSKPAPKTKPRAKVQPRGGQWETGERGAPLGGQFSGGFGYQAWRRPKR